MPSQPIAQKQPYYIAAPDYDAGSGQIRQIHHLCHALNTLGFEAYLAGPKVIDGHRWTPILSVEQQAAHYKAKKQPVRIYAGTDAPPRDQRSWACHYTSELRHPGPQAAHAGTISWSLSDEPARWTLPLALPGSELVGSDPVTHPSATQPRTRQLVYARNYLKAGGQLQPEHDGLENIAAVDGREALSTESLRAALHDAELLYCYELDVVTMEARWCGCPVVYVPNDRTLREAPASAWERLGTAWGDAPHAIAQARAELPSFQQLCVEQRKSSTATIEAFIAASQQSATELRFEDCWPEQTVEALGLQVIRPEDRPRRADQNKYNRIQKQFKTWRKRATLREIDGQIYAEHVMSGKLPPLATVIVVRGQDLEGLAKTLDSLQRNLLQPSELHVLAEFECPIDPLELGPNCQWHLQPQACPPLEQLDALWILLLEAGVELESQALVEFALRARDPGAGLIYSDEAFVGPDGVETPHFKPDLNVEWLRSTNYLGSVLAVRRDLWPAASQNSLDLDQAYALALDLTANPNTICHIDTVLYRSGGQVTTQQETREMAALQTHLQDRKQNATVLAHRIAGCRQLTYHAAAARQVSVIIPTGYQLGYLRCLLASLRTYMPAQLHEVILVAQAQHELDVRAATSGVDLGIPLQLVVTPEGPYCHGLALNAGAELATGDVLLIADDDTEAIQRDSLEPLLAYLDQDDVGCVAPRLVLQVGDRPTLQGGPMILGIGNWATSYNGEQNLLDEQGVFGRLQTSQDVPTVAGHFFLLRRQLWEDNGGFDSEVCHTFTTVHDFCIRSVRKGFRHIWTPVSSVLHQGGKTIEILSRQLGRTYELKNEALREKQVFRARWTQHISSDRSYNRHLSLQAPYDVDPDIVVDWMTTRKDRPTVLAFPISSGSGQYRVIEPLNALQQSGLAQTCVVFPLSHSAYRTPNALEIARTAPDRLIVQHSIADAHLQLLREYRQSNPDLFIIQMVDDVFHDLPEKHQLHVIHQREGYVRMREAMRLSNRVIVSTQPLADVYRDYCDDIRVMPNSLDDGAWGHFYKPPQARQRLRVGWAGAGQHQGDLEMIQQVIEAFENEVDWVFMGMCPDKLRPHIKEFHGFVSYVDYPAKLAALDLDIAIAPLEDNLFNRCKSNLRLLEYGAMGWPVVCSDVYPFRTENPPVLRVPNEKEAWIESLRRLIDDSALRHQMGQQLNQWVSDHFYLSKNTGKWFSAIFD